MIQHLVDWNKAMLSQIGGLGEKYHEWVNLPVDRNLRLFGPWYLECLTKTPWWIVPIFWIPSISYLLLQQKDQVAAIVNVIFINIIISLHYSHLQHLQTYLWNFLGGILLWTLVEYILHRYVFHMDTRKSGTAARTVHFILHGLHHKVPSDPYRLVFPPVPAVMIASVIYQMCYFLFDHPKLVLAGGLSGKFLFN